MLHKGKGKGKSKKEILFPMAKSRCSSITSHLLSQPLQNQNSSNVGNIQVVQFQQNTIAQQAPNWDKIHNSRCHNSMDGLWASVASDYRTSKGWKNILHNSTWHSKQRQPKARHVFEMHIANDRKQLQSYPVKLILICCTRTSIPLNIQNHPQSNSWSRVVRLQRYTLLE